MNWEELQKDISNWALANFGQQDAWQPMLGLGEEIGEYMAARHNRSNRGNEDMGAEMRDAIADQAIYVLNLCEICGINFADIAVISVEPHHISDGELLGVLGLCNRAVLKNFQGIRGYTYNQRRDHLQVSLTVWYRWALHQVSYYKLGEVLAIVQAVWAEVRKRNWKKNPENANLLLQSSGD